MNRSEQNDRPLPRSRFGMIGRDYSGSVTPRWGRRLFFAVPETTSARRVLLLMAAFVFMCSVIGARMLDLTMPRYQVAAISKAIAADDVGEQKRPLIKDRDGHVLAIDIATASLYADPAKISDIGALAQQLAGVLPIEEHILRARLDNPQRRFVWLARYLTPGQQAQVHDLGLPGIGFRREYRRVYPHGELFSHVLGYADIDNRGLAGLEKFLDRNEVPGEERSVTLSLHLPAQHVLRDELLLALGEFRARGAVACLMDVHSGEIAALVSLPDFDANHPMKSPPRARFNQATLGVYEPGSVFKPFTAAMALETAGLQPENVFDVRAPMRIGGFSIKDFHPQERPLNIAEILVHSSNIGAAQLALQVEEETHREFLQRFGLLQSATLELPEIGAPLLPKKWGDVERATLAFGYSISVSPLQLVSAAASLVNGGYRIQPTLLRSSEPLRRERILSEETGSAMRAMLRQVVLAGTGRKADVEGYPVLGKTGTAEKISAGRYDTNRHRTIFLGAFPAQEPRYALIVMLDEPKGHEGTFGYATAGWTAAPVAGRIIARVAPLLDLRPVSEDAIPERFSHLVTQP